MTLKTRIGSALKPLNAHYGSVALNWGTTPVMVVFMVFFLVFLLMILQIYNTSLIINNVEISWN